MLLDLGAPIALAAALLGLWHGAVLAGGMAAFIPSWAVLAPIAGLGTVVGFATGVLATPVVALARRFHRAWRSGDAAGASWGAALAWAGAVMAWMLADKLLGNMGAGTLAAAALRVGPALLAAWVGWVLPTPPRGVLRWGGVLAGLGAVLVVPWTAARLSPPPPASSVPAASPTAGAPDVILITVDTLRADRMGFYGHPGGLTPNLDALAAEGLRFDHGVTASPWTVPSLASIHTGLSTVRHGAGLPLDPSAPFLRTPLDGAHEALAERFAAAGYRTHAVVSNAFLSPAMGFDQGFQAFENPLLMVGAVGALLELPLTRVLLSVVPPEDVGDIRAQGITDRALAVLAEDASRPLFLWVHYADPHSPYLEDPTQLEWVRPLDLLEPPKALQPDGTVVGPRFSAIHDVRSGALWLTPADRARLETYYDRAVVYVDQEIGRLLDALRARPNPPVVVFTADHGEELWDHGGFEHGHAYWREVTRAPLVLWGPGVSPGVVSAPVGHVDVFPTTLALAGLDVPSVAGDDVGVTLPPLGPAPQGPRFAEGNLYDLPGALVVDGPWHLTLHANGQTSLYQVLEDPDEVQDRSWAEPDVTARLRAMAAPRLEATAGPSGGVGLELDVGSVEGLRALGYVE
ncbi:MAG: sulfatase [Alphaproteobacteria bacterium]|nr:sulfatase [Alphaproteobacteria bacterium]